ncbi:MULTISPECIES: hypothetical protein [Hyphomonas]
MIDEIQRINRKPLKTMVKFRIFQLLGAAITDQLKREQAIRASDECLRE